MSCLSKWGAYNMKVVNEDSNINIVCDYAECEEILEALYIAKKVINSSSEKERSNINSLFDTLIAEYKKITLEFYPERKKDIEYVENTFNDWCEDYFAAYDNKIFYEILADKFSGLDATRLKDMVTMFLKN